MFNPDAVRRWLEMAQDSAGVFSESGEPVVSAEDFDKLLVLYRKAIGERARHESEVEAFFAKHDVPNAIQP